MSNINNKEYVNVFISRYNLMSHTYRLFTSQNRVYYIPSRGRGFVIAQITDNSIQINYKLAGPYFDNMILINKLDTFLT